MSADPTPSSPRWHDRLLQLRLPAPVLLALATVLCLAPFLNKAVHVDDYLFVRSAQQILQHPLDPFGFAVNWYGFDTPCAQVTQNPPLACYYLAAVGGLFGWSEFVLHLAMLVPTVAAVLGIHTLARRYCGQPILAALLALVAPVFWLSSSTLMCDIAMVALWVWALECWLRGLDTGRQRWLATAALLVGLAALTKYFGAALLPLLLVHTVVRERRAGWKLLWLLVPLLLLAAYEYATRRLYGYGLIGGAVHYVQTDHVAKNIWRHNIVLFSFTGGCVLPLLFFAPRLWSRWYLTAAAVLFALIVALLPHIEKLGKCALLEDGAPRWSLIVQLAFLATVGASVLPLVVTDLWRHRSADSVLLALWVVGTLFFTTAINWSINGRSLLPLVPAAAILIVRRLDRGAHSPGPGRWHRLWPLAPAALCAALVVRADAKLADNSRTAARLFHEQLGPRPHPVWFQGHWGFQYYMEATGAKPFDRQHPPMQIGDYVITPSNNTNILRLPPELFAAAGDIEIGMGRLLTMRIESGAGFYADEFGPMPFLVDPGHIQTFRLEQMKSSRLGR